MASIEIKVKMTKTIWYYVMWLLIRLGLRSLLVKIQFKPIATLEIGSHVTNFFIYEFLYDKGTKERD